MIDKADKKPAPRKAPLSIFEPKLLVIGAESTACVVIFTPSFTILSEPLPKLKPPKDQLAA